MITPEKKKRNRKYNEAPQLRPYHWKKGQSGNPDGRPNGQISLVDELKKYLRRNPDELEKIVAALVREGRLGNVVATKEMMDRIDGRVVEKHEIEGQLPIRIQFVPAVQMLEQQPTVVIEGQARELKEINVQS